MLILLKLGRTRNSMRCFVMCLSSGKCPKLLAVPPRNDFDLETIRPNPKEGMNVAAYMKFNCNCAESGGNEVDTSLEPAR